MAAGWHGGRAGAFTAAQSALLGVVGNTLQQMNTRGQRLPVRPGPARGLELGAWTTSPGSWARSYTSFTGIEELAKGTAGAALNGMSSIFGFIDAMKTAYHDIDGLRNAVDDNIAKTMAQYLADQNKYAAALKAYKRALNKLRNYAARPPQTCPDPPPPAPPVTTSAPIGQPNIEGLRPDDPNDITGPAGSGAGHYLAENSSLDYTIHFENKATASLPARTVTVTSVLDPDADLSTFQLGSAGFGDQLVTAPAKRQSWSTTIDDGDHRRSVEVAARLDAATRTVTWTFTSLDPDTGDEPADALEGLPRPVRGRAASPPTR